MNTQEPMEERLWDYIDGLSMPEERSAIEALIESNIAWKRKYHELLDVHQLMSSSLELDEPSLRFTQHVMEDIARYQIAPAAQTFINKKIIWGIVTFFILTITAFLAYGIGQSLLSGGSGDSSSASNHLLDSYTSQLDKLNLNRFFNTSYTSIFVMVNAVISLFLLDLFLSRNRKTRMRSWNLE